MNIYLKLTIILVPMFYADARDITCDLYLFAPIACKIDKGFSSLYVAKLTMKQSGNADFHDKAPGQKMDDSDSGEDARGKFIVKERDSRFCYFWELRNQQHDRSSTYQECIHLNEMSYSDHLECPDENTVIIEAGARFVPESSFGGIEGAYTEDFTALEIKCVAPFPLGIKLNSNTTFAESKVLRGRILDTGHLPPQLPTRNSTKYNYWIKFVIPKNVRIGNLEDYSGQYSLFSILDPRHSKTINLFVEKWNSTRLTNPTRENLMEISDLRAKCSSSEGGGRPQLYLSNIAGGNPIDTQLNSPCLDKDKVCMEKQTGQACSDDPACQEIIGVFQNGRVRCVDESAGLLEEVDYFMGLDFRTYKNITVVPQEVVINIQTDDGLESIDIETVEETFEKMEAKNSSGKIIVFNQALHVFECHFIPYILTPPIEWIFTYTDGRENIMHVSSINEMREEDLAAVRGRLNEVHITYKSVRGTFRISQDMEKVACAAGTWDSLGKLRSEKELKIEESSAPTFKIKLEEPLKVEFGKNFRITCKSEYTNPPPSYVWKINDKEINSTGEDCIQMSNDQASLSSILDVCNGGSQHDGEFACIAINFRGNATKIFPVEIYKVGTSAWIYFGISCGLILVLLIVIFMCHRLYLKQRARLSELEIKAFRAGNEKEMKKTNYAHENAPFLPYNKDYEIPWNEITIIENQQLGKGAYGVVYKAFVRGVTVAAKTVAANVEKSVVVALLEELKIMTSMGKHENIVELIGASTKFLKQGQPFVFVEFCPLGNLHGYLHKHKEIFKQAKLGNYTNLQSNVPYENLQPIKDADLLQWSIQIAQGMEYLQELRIIHGDLATRNVLMKSVDNVKITDFGLSRQLVNCNTYVKKQQQMLPFRWMAVESLKYLTFTSKSDVWSFGITIWEIYTMGQTPYPGLSWSNDFVSKLENNLRLPPPEYGNQELFNMLMSCWANDAEDRPDFAQLCNILKTLADG